MLELSTATIQPIIIALRDVGAAIRLLAIQPNLMTMRWQRSRVRDTLTELVTVHFLGYADLSIGLYGVPPSLRGRRIGDTISLGWYTHRDNHRLDAENPDADEVWGHDNLNLLSMVNDVNGETMAQWFDREFERLWSHRSTIFGSALDEMLRLRS